MIPKVIHYFWFGGGELSPLMKRCIESWKKFAPDYEIKEWNESNFDINYCSYTKKAYEEKKYAFVADVARLYVIYEYGGIYMDVDVELLAPIDDLMKYEHGWMAFINERFIATGLGFAAPAKCNLIKILLDNYRGREFNLKRGIFNKVCTQIETEKIMEIYDDFKRNNKFQVMHDNFTFLPSYEIGKYSVHYGAGTWCDRENDGGEKELPKSKDTKWKRILRNPKNFVNINKYLGEKAEYIYEFLVYDLVELGMIYYIKRIIKRLKQYSKSKHI